MACSNTALKKAEKWSEKENNRLPLDKSNGKG